MLPVVILVLIALTGLAALPAASRRHRGSTWPLAIGVSTVLGVVGPIVSLLIFRDNPDQFVAIATVLVALLPIVVLTYALATRASP